jgi:hypothetical protein
MPETFRGAAGGRGETPPALGAREVHAWLIDLDRPQAGDRLETAGLSADERARAARFHFERDRTRFLHGRAALRTSSPAMPGSRRAR